MKPVLIFLMSLFFFFIFPLNGLATTPQESEQLKKLFGYYEATLKDRKQLDKAIEAAVTMTPVEWSEVNSQAFLLAQTMYSKAISPNFEEQQALSEKKWIAPKKFNEDLPSVIRDNYFNFIETAHGVVYSHRVLQKENWTPGRFPILVGGGFPFNQTQFVEFNQKISQVADIEFYDSVCTGITVLFDSVLNEGRGCRPYEATTGKEILIDEIAFQMAHSMIRNSAAYLWMSFQQTEEALFRLTRISYRGISLIDQAISIAAINEARGYKDGSVYYSGLSYGGFLGAKLGVLFPGRYRGLILFSPGIENPAHQEKNRNINAILENSVIHRRSVGSMIHDVAYSPRYDAYRPTVLEKNDLEFRNSLIKKMLGELDGDIVADLKRIQDPVFIVTGAKDASIDPQKQINAMKVLFSKPQIKGAFILIPNGGHALWGNPAQSAENAVRRIFEEIEKESEGSFEAGGVYSWNEQTDQFERLGYGLSGLDHASTLVESIRSTLPK